MKSENNDENANEKVVEMKTEKDDEESLKCSFIWNFVRV